jgi:hypothetical protein
MQLEVIWYLRLYADTEGPTLIYCAVTTSTIFTLQIKSVIVAHSLQYSFEPTAEFGINLQPWINFRFIFPIAVIQIG